MQGEFAVRVQNFRLAGPRVPSWKKGFFDLVVGSITNGQFQARITFRDWVLQESTQGQLYVMAPSKPMLQRTAAGTYEILKGADGKDRYLQEAYFERQSSEEGARLTDLSNETKQDLNTQAIAAYRSMGGVAAGVGSRSAPAGVSTKVEGAERGLPGDFSGALVADDDDLPF